MRVVIVEDHALFRDVMRKCITEFGFEVVGEAADGREAMRIIAATLPDVVLLDLHLPEVNGFEVAHFVHSNWPSVRILMLSGYWDDYTLMRVARSHAHGFVDKNTETITSLRLAFEALKHGQTFFSKAFLEAKLAWSQDPNTFTKILSSRECRILSLIGQSLTDVEIAQRLGVSPTTVQSHRSLMMRKLGIAGTPKLIHFALLHGFSEVPPQRAGQ